MRHLPYRQRGATLFVTLVMLGLLLMIGTSTMSSSVVDMRIATNTKDSVDALQRADAGVNAIMSLTGTGDDPFDGAGNSDPFGSFNSTTSPLRNVKRVDVATVLVQSDSPCGRSVNASSSSKIACQYYEINSNATSLGGAGAAVVQGVRRQVIVN